MPRKCNIESGVCFCSKCPKEHPDTFFKFVRARPEWDDYVAQIKPVEPTPIRKCILKEGVCFCSKCPKEHPDIFFKFVRGMRK